MCDGVLAVGVLCVVCEEGTGHGEVRGVEGCVRQVYGCVYRPAWQMKMCAQHLCRASCMNTKECCV